VRSSLREPRARHGVLFAACGALAGVALAGCGGTDDAGPDARSTPSTAATATRPAAVPAVSGDAAKRGVVLEHRNHGLRLWMRPSTDGDDRRLRATIQVMPTATVALRKRLARTTGVQLGCVADGVPSQGAIVRTSGPRDVTPVGHRISTGDFLTLPKGRTAPEAVRSCRLVVAPEERGSNTSSYSADPRMTVALYRFR
jgi:hypothetical protein